VTVGAGAQLVDINAELDEVGSTLPGGSCPSVGISGVTLGGGFGLESRHFGLTCDSLLAVQIVTADGKLQTVTAQSDRDLLWALKGGGGQNLARLQATRQRADPHHHFHFPQAIH
jgi:FAD/FMN-containing dehydrogenase